MKKDEIPEIKTKMLQSQLDIITCIAATLNISILLSYVLFVSFERLATKEIDFPGEYPETDSVCYGETKYDR